MPRQRRSGVVYPIKYTQKKTLKDGTVKHYESWHAKVNGKWVSAKTYKECDRKIAVALKEMTQWGAISDKTVKLGDYMCSWLESKRGEVDPGTMRNYESFVNVHFKPYHSARLADVTPSMAKRMLAGLKNSRTGGELSLGRIQIGYITLVQVFKTAVGDRIIPSNPMDGVPKPQRKDVQLTRGDSLPASTQDRKAFPVDQMQAMLQTAASGGIVEGTRNWWRILTGMRQSEILGATLEDLNLVPLDPSNPDGAWTGTYVMNWKLEEVKKRHGCGEPDRNGVYPCGWKKPYRCPEYVWLVPRGYDMIPLTGRFCLTPPKSQRGMVKQIIPPLATAVHRYLEATKDVPNPYGLLFRMPNGKPIGADHDLAAFRDLMRRSGIPDWEHRYGHECRNGAISLLFDMGVDPGIIRRIVGHSSVEMSEHYRTVPQSVLMAGMEKMEAPLDLRQIEWKTGGETA